MGSEDCRSSSSNSGAGRGAGTGGAKAATPSAEGSSTKKKFVGVRQRPSGRWVAEIKDTTQKIRLWLGTYDTAEEAAHAYDEAACLLRGANTRTNFLTKSARAKPPGGSPDDRGSPALASKIAQLVHMRRSQNASANASDKELPAVSAVGCRKRRHQTRHPDEQGLEYDHTELYRMHMQQPLGNLNPDCNQRMYSSIPDEYDYAFVQQKLYHHHDNFMQDSNQYLHRAPDLGGLSLTDPGFISHLHLSSMLTTAKDHRSNFNTITMSDNHLSAHKSTFMDAVLGMNDDEFLGSPDITVFSGSSHPNTCPFDFSVESTSPSNSHLASDYTLPNVMASEFPLMNQVSQNPQEAEELNSMSTNSEEIKRMRFERKVAGSLYAVNGVHEFFLKQSQAVQSGGLGPVPAGDVLSMSCSDNVPIKPASSPDNSSRNITAEATEDQDPQSQLEAAMWSSWDLAPLCPLSVA